MKTILEHNRKIVEIIYKNPEIPVYQISKLSGISISSVHRYIEKYEKLYKKTGDIRKGRKVKLFSLKKKYQNYMKKSEDANELNTLLDIILPEESSNDQLSLA